MTAEPPSETSTDLRSTGPTSSSAHTLRSLIAAYDHAVIFRESMPTPFALAKLFTEMAETHGGLLLVGVDADGTVIGIDPSDLDEAYARFERLCGELTETINELGALRIGEHTVMCLIFNTMPRHLTPFSDYRSAIERHCMV